MTNQGKANRNKGAAFERHVATELRAVYPDARRGYQRRSGSDEPDIAGTPWWVECKVSKGTPQVYRAYWQAERDSDGRSILVVSKQDRTDPLVTLTLSDFLDLLSRLAGNLRVNENQTLDPQPCDSNAEHCSSWPLD